MAVLPTHCKLLTETVSVSNIVIDDDTFVRVKVGHLNSLNLHGAVKEGEINYIFSQSLKLESYALSVILFICDFSF